MGENQPKYTDLVSGLRKTFKTGKTKQLWFRMQQLEKLLKMVNENQDLFLEAIKKDLRKPPMEATIMEINVVKGDATIALNNLPDWMGIQKVTPDLFNKMNTCGIKYDPLGVALIMGAWNYPILLVLQPLIGAIAAGNCVVIKPSELSPATANLFESLIPRYLDEECFKVVNGGIPETTSLLRERFDHIFYTGSSAVGKIVMQAAAKHLTPVVLELGGKSPCYVDNDCDFDVVASRISWGKFVNSGQTCLAPDYILCSKKAQDKLVPSLRKAFQTFFGENPKESPDLSRMVNNRHLQRVAALIDSNKTAIGGNIDESDKYIAPTVLVDVMPNDPVMQEEIFGPVLPIVNVDSVSEASQFIAEREKPLGLYIFSNDRKHIDKLIDETSSGAVCVNDCIVHAAVPTLPFGGVGNSGMGAYHGKFSFEAFSHKKACLIKNQKLESLNGLRYPPYKDKNLKFFTWLLVPSRKSKVAKYVYYLLLAGMFAVVFTIFNVGTWLKKLCW